MEGKRVTECGRFPKTGTVTGVDRYARHMVTVKFDNGVEERMNVAQLYPEGETQPPKPPFRSSNPFRWDWDKGAWVNTAPTAAELEADRNAVHGATRSASNYDWKEETHNRPDNHT